MSSWTSGRPSSVWAADISSTRAIASSCPGRGSVVCSSVWSRSSTSASLRLPGRRCQNNILHPNRVPNLSERRWQREGQPAARGARGPRPTC